MDKYQETLHPRFNKQFIIEDREIILNNNSFQFNNINYIQTLGTAGGTKMAPALATLTLAYFEENLYEIIGKKYGNDIKEFTKSWKRYLDDCFIFWKYPWKDINELHDLLQNLHRKIKFTMENSLKELPFLDILIKKNVNGQIITDIYHKPTDTQQYLHFKSHHPQKCIKSIPCRIDTIITTKNLKLKKLALKNYAQPYTREDTQQN